jgi:hypothetical protein
MVAAVWLESFPPPSLTLLPAEAWLTQLQNKSGRQSHSQSLLEITSDIVFLPLKMKYPYQSPYFIYI